MNRAKLEILIFIILSAFILTITVYSYESLSLFEHFYQHKELLIIFLTAFLSSYLAFLYKALDKAPTPLRIFVIGQPRAGKTVFLSVLFDELQRISVSGIDFQQYGSETIEVVTNNINTLRKRTWIPKTLKNNTIFYRAKASVGTTILKSKYTIEIGDYAGENIGEFDTSSEMWLHKTDYFKYAVASDALIFCIDGEILKSNDISSIENSQSMLIAAFQMLLTEKTEHAGKKIKIPICVVVLKCDLFNSQEEIQEKLMNYYFRLTDLIRNKTIHYKEFFISSVGFTYDNYPPLNFKPINVCAPMVWILKNTNL